MGSNRYDELSGHHDYENNEQEIEDIFPNNKIRHDEFKSLESLLNNQEDKDKAFLLVSLESHCVKGKAKKPFLLCKWKDGNTSWEDFINVRIDFPSMWQIM